MQELTSSGYSVEKNTSKNKTFYSTPALPSELSDLP